MSRYKMTFYFESDNLAAMKATDKYLVNTIFPDCMGIQLIDDEQSHVELDKRTVQGFIAEDIIGCAVDHGYKIPDEDQIENIMDMMEKRYDANIGMSWEVILIHIDDEMPVEIQFEQIDDWNRPVFKDVRSNKRFGSVDRLIGAGDIGKDISDFITEKDLVFFGFEFNCEPSGNPAGNIKIIKEKTDVTI